MTFDFGAYVYSELDRLSGREPEELADIGAGFERIQNEALEGRSSDTLFQNWKSRRTNREHGDPKGIRFPAIAAPKINIRTLPPYSWYLRFCFKLARPVTTKDEDLLGATENMFRKEPATGHPVFAASSWKGAFAAALRQILSQAEFEKSRQLLFGGAPSENETEDSSRGRLTFFASFFDSLSIYVIHPQNRGTKIGTPITYEVIPEGGSAWFSLLYCPLGSAYISSHQALKLEYREHLGLVARGLYAMFQQCGFGGKTSSGFGLADETVHDWQFSENVPTGRLGTVRIFRDLLNA